MAESVRFFTEAAVQNRVEAVLHRTDHAIYEYSNFLFNQIGSTFQQACVLAFIHFNKGCNQRAIEKALQIRSASVTVLLNTMAGKGIIDKTRNPVDGREVILSLTPKGKRVLTKCREVFDTIEEVVSRDIPPEDLDTLARILTKMADNCRQAEEMGWHTIEDMDDEP
ncbi:MAG: MarR family transcriptional regulator [Planctomycetes bacterium]|nr:MarR family transcriptional regulator [Planctomycetota bacterium]